MKSIKYLAIAVLGTALLYGCRGKEKLFVNPNSSGSGTPSTQLTEVEVATINSYEGDINRTGAIFVQHMAGVDGQSVETQEYAMTQSNQDNNWSQLYANMLNADKLRKNFGSERPFYDGMAEILIVMNIGLATDIYGDVPFREALQGAGNLAPHFDPQQSIYSTMITMLDDAIGKLAQPADANATVPGTDDIIFGGDVSLWTKTAYTLKARYLNRLSNKPDYDPAAILDAMSKGIQANEEDCMGTHDGSNGQNQWYAFLNARAYMRASASLVDSMKLRPTDLRLYYYFDSSQSGGVVTGCPIDQTDASASYYGRYLAGDISNALGGDPTVSTPMVTYMEALFIKAEVLARQGSPNAAAALNDAIMASCEKVTQGAYNGSDIATYTNANTNLSRVMYEKWIAMYGQTEAYSDYRRTKLPALTPNPKASIPTIPERFPISLQETNSNPNVVNLPITTPVWWAL
ncbi:MAG: SusD/RagB family nutrient-binding outer membrane lipoprotein [Bacteroidetes bacterium]|nr:SusD/RagB family nutrient-binding outer membrane lipoprotein [Bacteroidota bacterium]MBS1629192.1 SusD/RagB family nutrient-binding outer membrane lipoprotein [Bacteroidota bacterium]